MCTQHCTLRYGRVSQRVLYFEIGQKQYACTVQISVTYLLYKPGSAHPDDAHQCLNYGGKSLPLVRCNAQLISPSSKLMEQNFHHGIPGWSFGAACPI